MKILNKFDIKKPSNYYGYSSFDAASINYLGFRENITRTLYHHGLFLKAIQQWSVNEMIWRRLNEVSGLNQTL
jgi:hypothetical protein